MKILNVGTVASVLGENAKDLRVVKSTKTSLTVTTDRLPGVTVELAVSNDASKVSDVIRRQALIDIEGGKIVNVRDNEAPKEAPASTVSRGCLLRDVIR